MKKLKSFLEATAIRLLSVAPIVTTFAGGIAGLAAVTALGVGAPLALAGIMTGTCLGFAAGYAGISLAPERMTGLPKASFGQQLKTGALLPLQGAVEIVRLMSAPFNDAARRKARAKALAPAPAPQAQPAQPKP